MATEKTPADETKPIPTDGTVGEEYEGDPPEAEAPDALAGAGLTADDIIAASQKGPPPTVDPQDAALQSLELRLTLLQNMFAALVEYLGPKAFDHVRNFSKLPEASDLS